MYGKTLAAGAIESTLNGMCILKMRSEAGKMNEFWIVNPHTLLVTDCLFYGYKNQLFAWF